MVRNRFRTTREDWNPLPKNTSGVNRNRGWKYNPKCSQAWKNQVKRIELAERYKSQGEIKDD